MATLVIDRHWPIMRCFAQWMGAWSAMRLPTLNGRGAPGHQVIVLSGVDLGAQ